MRCEGLHVNVTATWRGSLPSARMQMLALVEPATAAMLEEGIALGPAGVPAGYRVRSGAQLD